jgi:shikimate kinase
MESIILTGPKYSGKTSTGRVLALLYFCEFIDLDDLILQKTGKTPRELYSEDPAKFRKAETEAIAGIAESGVIRSGRQVIGTGGGIIDNPEAIAILEDFGATVVYLNISADSAWDRISNAESELPPFLRTENPQETHRTLHERRAAAYPHLAKIIIQTDKKTPEEIAHEIAERTGWGHEKTPEGHRRTTSGHPDESKPHCFGRDF